MTTIARSEESVLNRLKDKKLFRSFAYVDGMWISGSEGRVIKVTDPASGWQLGDVAALTGAQSLDAVAAARRAFGEWSAMLPQERSACLYRWFTHMRDASEDLAVLMTLEQGKPLSESRGEIDYAASFIEFYAEEAKRPNIEGVTSHLKGAEMEVWREPSGVAGLITPWNFPSAMLTRKAGAALAAGCTVVAHPSSETPYSALALAELADRAGVPKGVFNVVTGRAVDIVTPWQETPDVRVLSFTGSTEVGRLLYRQASTTLKRLVMELGGHAPFLVFADAELEWAVEQAMAAKFATSGQDCLAANRIFVERPLYQAFCNRFTERTKTLTVGPGIQDPDIGPLMNERALKKQIEHVRDAVDKGARVLTGGERHSAGSLFFTPTVLGDVPPDALIMHEETFGPVAAIAPFDDEREVITRANASEYGLVAYLHTRDPRRIYRVSRALQFGMVAVNRTKVTGAPIPFGGMKQSGIGREGARLGMEAFMEVKYVCRDWA